MSTSAKLILLAGAIGADVKLLTEAQGDLSALPTTAKDNLVAALTEIHTLASSGGSGVVIDDAAEAGATTVVFSADKVLSSLAAGLNTLKSDLLGGAGAAYDTFKELQDLLVGQDDAVAALTALFNNAVRFDQAQSLTDPQKATARGNIGAAAATDLAALTTAVGDTEADLVAAYNAAKA